MKSIIGMKYAIVTLLIANTTMAAQRADTVRRVRKPFQSATSIEVPSSVSTSTSIRSAIHQYDSKVLHVRGGVVINTLPRALAGTGVFMLIEKIVKMTFKAADIKFPGMLGACIALFVALCLLDLVSPDAATATFEALTPGATILAKWLPVFFVPGLALLPLSPSIPGSVDVFKIVLLSAVGLVYTMGGTVMGVSAVQWLTTVKDKSSPIVTKKSPTLPKPKVSPKSVTIIPAAIPAVASPKPFTDAQWKFCWTGTLLTGLVSAVATKTKFDYARPIQALCLGLGTVAAYVWGARLPASFVRAVHPLVSSSIVLLGLVHVLALISGQDFESVLRSYKTGTLNPFKAGAADYLFYILGPSVVSFAISMYSRKNLLFRNLPMVVTAALISSAGGLFVTAAMIRFLQIGGANGTESAVLRVSCLARNITTALALAVTEMLHGDLSIVAAVVCVTGILGASYGKALLQRMGVTNPIVRGLGIGSSSQGLGVASLADEPDAFPFAAMSMVLTAISATTLVSFPTARDALIRVATGTVPAP